MSKRIVNVLIGPFLFFAMLAIPLPGLSYEMHGAVGLLLWILYWWITQPVGPSVTSLLPILIVQFFKLTPTASILSNYFSATIVLIMSANIITICWTKSGFDRRLALNIMLRVGNNPKVLVTMWFILSVALSSMIANAAIAAAFLPIVLTTIKAIGIEDDQIKNSNYAMAALFAVAWGSNIGFGTPLGGAMNLVVVDLIQKYTGTEFMYSDWVVRCIPLTICVAAPMLFMILKTTHIEYKSLPGTKEIFQKELDKLGPMKRSELIGALLFFVSFGLSMARPLFSSLLPTFTPNYIFMLGALLTFVIPGEDGAPMLTWGYAQPKIKWGVLFLIAGGTSLGNIITQSGVGGIISDALVPIAGISPFIAIVVFSVMGCFFSNIMMVTGCTALLGPIIIDTMLKLGQNPLPYLFICYAAFNISICLPSSGAGPAMVAGYGVDLKTMIKWGLKTIPLCLAVTIVIGYLIYTFIPGFSAIGI